MGNCLKKLRLETRNCIKNVPKNSHPDLRNSQFIHATNIHLNFTSLFSRHSLPALFLLNLSAIIIIINKRHLTFHSEQFLCFTSATKWKPKKLGEKNFHANLIHHIFPFNSFLCFFSHSIRVSWMRRLLEVNEARPNVRIFLLKMEIHW